MDDQMSLVDSAASAIWDQSQGSTNPKDGHEYSQVYAPVEPGGIQRLRRFWSSRLADLHLSCPQGVVTNRNSEFVDNGSFAGLRLTDGRISRIFNQLTSGR